MKTVSRFACLVAAALIFAGCSTAPKNAEKVDELRTAVDSTIKRVDAIDPSLQKLMNNAYAYAVFPTVGKGGVIVGGAYGRGEVYERGVMVGWADISQATIGAQLGGQTFTEVILFESQEAFNNFKNNKLKFAANVSAVAMKSGAADSAKYTNGVLVFVEPKAGLMLEAAVGGQSFSYQPK